MRVLVLVKATKNSEKGLMPGDAGAPKEYEQLMEEMGRFNEKLMKAGVLLSGDGLHPSSRGKRVTFGGRKQKVIDGPFAETKELVAGFWVWKVKSVADAVKWVKQCPDPMPGEESEIEIRPIIELEDLGPAFAEKQLAKEKKLRAKLEKQQKAKS